MPGSLLSLVQTPPLVPPAPPAVEVISGGPPAAAIVVVVLVAIAAVTILMLPVMRAWGRRLDGGTAAPTDSELGARVEHLEQRLADAEERLDFAERMLARGPDPVALPREKAD